MPRPRKPIALLGVAVLLLSACQAFEVAAAVVDDRKIEDETFRRTADFVLAGPQFSQLTPEQGEEQRRTVLRQLLTFLIHQQIIEAEAAERGITVADDEVDRLLDAQIEGLGGDESFQQQLEQSGLTVVDVRDLLRGQLLREQVSDAVVAEELPEEELRQEYESRLAEFTTVDVAHILVRNRNLAQRLTTQATPRNFARLAREFSQDSGSAQDGGRLGSRPASDFVEPFAEAVLEIPVGRVGGPVRTDFGFHVIHVIDREALPFEEVREQLLDERAGDIFATWLLEEAAGAQIRVNPRYGVYSDEQGQVIPRTATTPLPGPQVTP